MEPYTEQFLTLQTRATSYCKSLIAWFLDSKTSQTKIKQLYRHINKHFCKPDFYFSNSVIYYCGGPLQMLVCKYVRTEMYLQFMGDHVEGVGVQVGSRQHLTELRFLLLQCVIECTQFALQQQVFKATFLLNLLDGFSELHVQLISLQLNLHNKVSSVITHAAVLMDQYEHTKNLRDNSYPI